MTGWFSRRSGSRVSLQNPVRRVLRAQSLSRNPRPPRTTRKSDRRKVSDRTMVGLAQPLCLSASGTEPRRYDSTMNLRKCKTTAPVSNSGWMTTRSPVEGEPFLLTSPFIERDSRKLAHHRLLVGMELSPPLEITSVDVRHNGMTNEMCADGKYAKLSTMQACDTHFFLERATCKRRGGEVRPD